MDMTLRSFIIAGTVLAVLAAGLAGWWLFDRFGPAPDRSDGRVIIAEDYDDREGSLRDEFGASPSRGDDRITITSGEGLFADDIFDRDDDRDRGWDREGGSRFADGPRFDWSRSGSGRRDDRAPLPRDTAPDRVEADCRIRGGGAYACRCLVRLARRDLSEPEFELLSLAEEPAPRAERLTRADLDYGDIAVFSARLVALDAQAERRCGAGLTR